MILTGWLVNFFDGLVRPKSDGSLYKTWMSASTGTMTNAEIYRRRRGAGPPPPSPAKGTLPRERQRRFSLSPIERASSRGAPERIFISRREFFPDKLSANCRRAFPSIIWHNGQTATIIEYNP